jgi:hypothetical protein
MKKTKTLYYWVEKHGNPYLVEGKDFSKLNPIDWWI